jgi:hypothetical protein
MEIFDQGGRSTKELFEQLINCFRNIYVHELATWHLPVHVLHEHIWTALGCRPLAYCSTLTVDIRHLQVRVQCKARPITSGHHYGETWPRSAPFFNKESRPGFGRLHRRRALYQRAVKNSLLIAIRNIYMYMSSRQYKSYPPSCIFPILIKQ